MPQRSSSPSLSRSVAMREGASSGFFGERGEVVARVRLGSHRAGLGRPLCCGLVAQQRQHGLVAAVHAVEVADGQRAGRRDTRMVEAAKNLHREVLFW
jgi:hypothetical protein